MRRPLIALLSAALLTTALVAPVSAANDNGKQFAEGAFRSVGTGLFVTDLGTAMERAAIRIPAALHKRGVLIFGYEGGPSDGQAYCGDVWNVIVTVDFQSPEDKAFMAGVYADHYLDGDRVGANRMTPIRPNLGVLVRVHGTFLPPGTLSNGPHSVKQTLEHPDVPFPLWDPNAVSIEVTDSAC